MKQWDEDLESWAKGEKQDADLLLKFESDVADGTLHGGIVSSFQTFFVEKCAFYRLGSEINDGSAQRNLIIHRCLLHFTCLVCTFHIALRPWRWSKSRDT